jgi:hypothetical protein
MLIILIAILAVVFPKPLAWQIKQKTELHEPGARHIQHIISKMVSMREHFVALIMYQSVIHAVKMLNLGNVTINNIHVIMEQRIQRTLTQQDHSRKLYVKLETMPLGVPLRHRKKYFFKLSLKI